MGRLTDLRKSLETRYTLESLEVLCADIDVPWESLGGDTLPRRALSLLQYLDTQGRLPDLIDQARKDFPGVTWALPAPAKPGEADDDDLSNSGVKVGVKVNVGDVSGQGRVNIGGIADATNNTGQVAVGSRNVIQIGSLNVPRWLVIAVPVLIVAGLVIAGIGTARIVGITQPTPTPVRGPATMSGQFNVIVAQAAETDPNGAPVATAAGLKVSDWVYKSLQDELKDLPTAQIWHDNLPRAEMENPIGIITGTNAVERWQTAQQLAKDRRAHLVIYGNLKPSGEFAPEVYIDVAAAKLAGEADDIIGGHQLGGPMSVDASSAGAGLNAQAELRSRAVFVRGLVYDLVGRHEDALKDFQRAAPDWNANPGKGKETLDYFTGREILYLIDQDDAIKRLFGTRDQALNEMRARFESALDINPGYALAHMGLGSAALKQAEPVITGDSADTTSLAFGQAMTITQTALKEYDAALKAAQADPARFPLLDTKALIQLANAYSLDGQAKLLSNDAAGAQVAFDLARQQLAQAANGAGMDRPRIAANADWVSGSTASLNSALKFLQGDDAASLDLARQARAAFTACQERYDDPENKRDSDRTLKYYKARCQVELATVQQVIEQGGKWQ